MDQSFSDRMRVLQGTASGRSFAQKLGIPPSTLRALLAGHSPTLETLNLIASATGVSIQWLATGRGPQLEEKIGQLEAVERPDPELFGRVVDRIARVYREARVSISEIDKGRLAAERYWEIVSQAKDAEEWPAYLEIMEVRLRRSLHAAAQSPGQTKREVS